MLTNTAPVAANAFKSDLIEVTAGNGYPAGGVVATITSAVQTGGVFKLVLADVVWSATGAGFGPFRYPVLYNDTAPSKELIGWWDYGLSTVLNGGETFTGDYDPATGVLTIT